MLKSIMLIALVVVVIASLVLTVELYLWLSMVFTPEVVELLIWIAGGISLLLLISIFILIYKLPSIWAKQSMESAVGENNVYASLANWGERLRHNQAVEERIKELVAQGMKQEEAEKKAKQELRKQRPPFFKPQPLNSWKQSRNSRRERGKFEAKPQRSLSRRLLVPLVVLIPSSALGVVFILSVLGKDVQPAPGSLATMILAVLAGFAVFASVLLAVFLMWQKIRDNRLEREEARKEAEQKKEANNPDPQEPR